MKAKILSALKTAAFDSSPLGMIILTENSHKCLFINTTATDLLAVTKPDDFSIADCYGEKKEDGTQMLSADWLKRRGRFINVVLKTLDRRLLVVNLVIAEFKHEGEIYLSLCFQDLTQQLKMQRDLIARENQIRQAFDELLKQNSKLKELDRAKDRFIGLVTHELRTPLSAVMATIDFIHQGFCTSEVELKQLIKTAMEQGAHLAELIDDILDFSKLQTGKAEFYIELSSVAGPVNAALEALRIRAEQFTVSLIADPSIGACPPCYFDELRLRQILDNILSNAIKFNTTNGKVSVTASWSEDIVTLHISDTGRGIAPNDLERVFNEFETLGQMSKHQKGTGLGMPISRRLIESMGGKIGVRSELGKGSEFWIEIPVKKILTADFYRSRPKDDDLLAS